MRSFSAVFSLIALGLALAVPPASALTIDEFDGSQPPVIANPPDGTATGITSAITAVGGTRAITVKAYSGNAALQVVVDVSSGELSHSQAANVTGESWVVWDGDLDVGNLDSNGLGSIDITQDSGTALRLKVISFDYPNANPITLRVTLYDSSDPTGAKFSRATHVLNSQIISVTNIDIPFANFTAFGPNGAADLTSIGAIELSIDGQQSPAADLTFAWVGTNGICELIPDMNGRVIDQCGVCGGDGTSCLDCAGVPFGTSVFDECGVCGGDNSTCADCLGAPNGNAQFDICNVCNGDGTSCLDCAGNPFGSAVPDRCNVCNGDGQTCLECEEKDQSQDLTQLDAGAKRQEALIKNLTKRLGTLNRTKKIKDYNASTRAKAHALQLRNWTLSWVLPVVVVDCNNVEFCISKSNSPILDEYRANNVLLRDLALDVIKKIKKYTKGVTLHSEVASAKKAEKLFQDNLTLANSIPEFQDSCS